MIAIHAILTIYTYFVQQQPMIHEVNNCEYVNAAQWQEFITK